MVTLWLAIAIMTLTLGTMAVPLALWGPFLFGGVVFNGLLTLMCVYLTNVWVLKTTHKSADKLPVYRWLCRNVVVEIQDVGPWQDAPNGSYEVIEIVPFVGVVAEYTLPDLREADDKASQRVSVYSSLGYGRRSATRTVIGVRPV